MKANSELRAGEWIQVRSKAEILRTLDKNGQLDGLPFMPEMFEFCGKRFRVFKRAHKTCDPPNGLAGRRMLRAVHLELLRCDGSAHGGCQAGCLMFWKDSWLARVEGPSEEVGMIQGGAQPGPAVPETGRGCTEADVVAGACPNAGQASPDELVYICQSTHMSQATLPLSKWDVSQYIEDYTSGNVRLSQIFAAAFVFLYSKVVSAGIGLGSGLRWLYDFVQKMRGGALYPWRTGNIPVGAKTPSTKLDLRPGELVRVRSVEEILPTINELGLNRGMSFDPEMVPYCGGTYRVLNRITTIINDETGKMQSMKNDCIVLDGVVCRLLLKISPVLSRTIFPYWREIWLERAPRLPLGIHDKPPVGAPG